MPASSWPFVLLCASTPFDASLGPLSVQPSVLPYAQHSLQLVQLVTGQIVYIYRETHSQRGSPHSSGYASVSHSPVQRQSVGLSARQAAGNLPCGTHCACIHKARWCWPFFLPCKSRYISSASLRLSSLPSWHAWTVKQCPHVHFLLQGQWCSTP